MTNLLKAAAIAVAVLGTGGTAVVALNRDVPDLAVPQKDWRAGSELDGRAFRLSGTVTETGEAMPETTLSFVDGEFQSSRCQVACAFGWNEYQTWSEGEVIHFTATSRCPDAPFTVVWYGTVSGDEVQFELSWTTRRWYWTHQITGDGVGTPTDLGAGAHSG